MKKNAIAIRKKADPSVSILAPVNKKYPHFKESKERIRALLKQAETTLLRDFPSKKVNPIISDMYKLEQSIDYRNLSGGLGLYISPYREKIFHFPFAVKEKVIIDKTFEVRDLLLAVKNNFNYGIVTISESKVRIFNGFEHTLTEVKNEEMPYNIKDIEGKGHSRIGSFTSFSSSKNVSDSKEHTEKQMEKYLMEIDRVIASDIILKTMPLIICGSKRICGHYKNISKNANHILGYSHGNYDKINTKEIISRTSNILEARLTEIQNNALVKLEDAMGERKAVSGIRDVWKAAYNKEGRLLLVEKDYDCPAKTGKRRYALITDNLDKYDIRYMSDAVDDTIELVLKYGGDVVFMESGQLDTYSKIALITYL